MLQSVHMLSPLCHTAKGPVEHRLGGSVLNTALIWEQIPLDTPGWEKPHKIC